MIGCRFFYVEIFQGSHEIEEAMENSDIFVL